MTVRARWPPISSVQSHGTLKASRGPMLYDFVFVERLISLSAGPTSTIRGARIVYADHQLDDLLLDPSNRHPASYTFYKICRLGINVLQTRIHPKSERGTLISAPQRQSSLTGINVRNANVRLMSSRLESTHRHAFPTLDGRAASEAGPGMLNRS